MNNDDFLNLTLDERIAVVDKRFGGSHPDRITKPSELIDVLGNIVYFVISPFGQEQDIGNAVIYTMTIDRIISNNEEIITSPDQVSIKDDVNYMCIHDGDDFKALSIKDFNILPNTHNNHAAFTTMEGAEAYAMFRKLQWKEDENLKELEGEYDYWITQKQFDELGESA